MKLRLTNTGFRRVQLSTLLLTLQFLSYCTADDLSLYLEQASVQKKEYQLSYDANNNSGQVNVIKTRNKDTVTIQSNTHTKTGYYI